MKAKLIINYFLIFIFIFSFQSRIFCSNKIYVNSIPKCGTHLLTKCVELITKNKAKGFKKLTNNDIPKINNNEFFFSHVIYSVEFEKKLEAQNYKVLFIYRDPRDQIVSNSFWIREKNFRYERYGFKNQPSVDVLINFFIQRIDNIYKSFLPWMNSKLVHSVRFENLVGPQGQGDLTIQKRELKKISNFIGVKQPRINQFINLIYGGTGTFRKGQIGTWKEHFTEQQKQEFKKNAGQLLIDLGYEKDLNW
jgi:hypothetical protein